MTSADPANAPTASSKGPARRRGRFVTLEGGEGAGKSTQQKILLERLEQAGIRAIGTREPGGSPKAEQLREILLSGAAAPMGPLAEAMLFCAARIDHLDQTIRPALAQGIWVVCDRFSDSTRAYQGTLGNVDPRLIRALERVTLGDTRPNLTLVMDLPAEIGLARAAARRGTVGAVDRFEAENMAFHRALRASFRAIAEAEPKRCVLIDASGRTAEVAERIWGAITRQLFSARMRTRSKSAAVAAVPETTP